MNLLLSTLFHALWFVFVVRFILSIPWPKSWKVRKPLSCQTCLVGWLVIAMALYRAPSLKDISDGFFVLVSAGGLAVLLLAVHDYWRGAGLQPPE